MSSGSLSRDELLAELRRLNEELGRVPTTADMTAHGEYSIAPYYNRFESWTAAIEAAGYEPHTTPVRRTRDELVADLHRLADEHGRPPTNADIQAHGIASPETYRDRFGSLNDALEAAGFERRTTGVKIPREELCDALRTLADDLERPPTATDMRTQGPYSAGTASHQQESPASNSSSMRSTRWRQISVTRRRHARWTPTDSIIPMDIENSSGRGRLRSKRLVSILSNRTHQIHRMRRSSSPSYSRCDPSWVRRQRQPT